MPLSDARDLIRALKPPSRVLRKTVLKASVGDQGERLEILDEPPDSPRANAVEPPLSLIEPAVGSEASETRGPLRTDAEIASEFVKETRATARASPESRTVCVFQPGCDTAVAPASGVGRTRAARNEFALLPTSDSSQ